VDISRIVGLSRQSPLQESPNLQWATQPINNPQSPIKPIVNLPSSIVNAL
jgi:hypothetical protein